jgi:hypothetical protein
MGFQRKKMLNVTAEKRGRDINKLRRLKLIGQ